MPSQQQVVTLSIFRFDHLWGRVWAFHQMLLAHLPLRGVQGQTYYQLLGSGRKAFDPRPNWSQYALLQVWEDQASAEAYFERHDLWQSYLRRSSSHQVLYLRCTRTQGKWSGQEPFVPLEPVLSSDFPVVVITRATIRLRLLRTFWRSVPASQETLSTASGLLFAGGYGEWPLTRMMTLSIWRSEADMKAFAYGSRGHQEAIKKTRALDWYSEELFSRYQLVDTEGDLIAIDGQLA